MKKTLLAVVCLITAISILATPICAAESGYFSVQGSNVQIGDTFEVILNITGGEDIGTIGIIPSFDDLAFEFVSGRWLVSGALEEPDITKNGAALLAFSGTEAVNGPVYSFTLRVKESAQYGTYTIGGKVNIGFTISVSSATVSVGNGNNNGGNPGGNGNGHEHSFTDKNTSETYKKQDATCTAPAVYYYSCRQCGEASTTETFSYGNRGNHNFSERVVDSGYLAKVATCDGAAEYYLSCECGEKGRETFTYGSPTGHSGGAASCTKTAICSVCGKEYGGRGEHSYTEKVPSGKFLARAASCTEKATYYLSCLCGEKGRETFTYGQSLGHQFDSKWEYDDSRHYSKCTQCGEIGESGQHVPGPEANQHRAQECTVCGYVIAPPVEHIHEYDDNWNSDSASHWKTCSCGQIFNSENHMWSEGKVLKEATVDEYGQIEYICRVCYYGKVEYTAMLTPEPEWPTDYPQNDPADGTTDYPQDEPTKETSAPPADDPTKETVPQSGDGVAEETAKTPSDDPADNPAETDLADTDAKTEAQPNVALILMIIFAVAIIGVLIILFTAKKKR